MKKLDFQTMVEIGDTAIGIYAKQHAIIINESETIGYSLNHMIKYHLRHIPVINEAMELVGVLTARDILGSLVERENIDFLRQKNVDVMSKFVYSIKSSTTLKDTILTMSHADLTAIPVISGSNNIDGIFTAKDIVLLDNLWNTIPDTSITKDTGPGRPVRPEEIVHQGISLWDAILKFHEQKSRYLFINDSDNDVFTGIISVEKILGALVPMLMFGHANIQVFKQRKIDSIVRESIKMRELPTLVKPMRMWMRNMGIEIVVLLDNRKAVKILHEKHLLSYLINYL